MPAAVRPYVTAGVALVGASVISVTPIAPTSMASTPARVSSQQVALTAATSTSCTPESTSPLCETFSAPSAGSETMAVMSSGSSLLYVPINMVTALLSVPAWEIQAMDRFADAMIATGSWQVWGPTNVFGFDEQDPPKLRGFVDMLIPFQPFSSVLGEDMSWWARANLPMNSGCAALPGACPDRGALLDSMFQVPLSELYDGYTFPTEGEGVTNPFTGNTVPWAGATPEMEPFGPFKASWDWLTAPPHAVETVKLSDYFTVPAKLGKSLFDAFYPFVQNSEWYNDDQTGFAPLFRALAPYLCPSCDPENPYDNPYLYDNYPPNGQAGVESADADPTALSAAAPQESSANTESPSDGEENSETSDPVTAAVTGLMKKFDFATPADDATSGADAEPADDVAETAPEATAEEAADGAEEADEASINEVADDTDEDPESIDQVADDTDDIAESGSTGKHRKADDDDGSTSVSSIQDKVSSHTGGRSASGTDAGSSDSGSSDSGSSDSGSSDSGGDE